MDDHEPTPLNYADPDQQQPPKFSVHWGGWVLLAAAAGVVLVEWLK